MRLAYQSVRRFSQRLSSLPSIPSEEFEHRRQRLISQVRTSIGKEKDASFVILLKGGERSYSAPDVPHVFRQCSHFRYLTGVLEPDCYYLLYGSESGRTKKILFMDRRSEQQVLWEGEQTSDSQLELTAKFDELLPINNLSRVLTKLASPSTTLLAEPSALPKDSYDLIQYEFACIRGARSFIDQLRFIKSRAELDMMRSVISIGAQTICGMMASSKGAKNENVIVGLLEYEARKRGAERLAYPPVVAAGNRANTIHYLDANKSIGPDDTILVDGGVELQGYVSDITACYPVSGRFTAAQRTLYEALLFVHQQLLEYANHTEMLSLNKLFVRMQELLAAAMREAGVISSKVTTESDLIAMANELCAHHVSHYLGMDVHDCSSVSRDIPLPPGVPFTIEPGVYVPIGSRFPIEFQGIGYRIEDDVLTLPEGGVEVLSSAVPREPQAIEFLLDPSRDPFYYSHT